MTEQTEQQEEQQDASAAEAPDFSFVPETFVKEGKPDTGAFRASYDELATFKAQADEAAASKPQSPDDYALNIPEGFEGLLPEGFTPPADFKLELADDPDIPELRATLHKHGAPKEMMDDLAALLAKREIRAFHEATVEHRKEMEALGPTAQSRVDTLKRAVAAKLPKVEADALLNGLSMSANAVRGLERLFQNAPKPSTSPGSGSLEGMTPAEKVVFGLNQRRAAGGK